MKQPIIISGPCSAETYEQLESTALELKKFIGNFIFRAGLWKPRTRPGNFEGVGEKGLSWLQKIQYEHHLKCATEIATPKHLELCIEHGITHLWIGARTVANPFSVQELANAISNKKDITVYVKNPIHEDPELWIGAIERIKKAGIENVMAIHRGFSQLSVSAFRNNPLWNIPIQLKAKMPELKIICDISHISGTPELLFQTAQQAMDLNMDGLMIETHIKPQEAWSDSEQQITPKELKSILGKLKIRNENSGDIIFTSKLEELRSKIDELDMELIKIMNKRMAISRKIGKYKEENNVTILQIERWKNILKTQIEMGNVSGLSEEFIESIYKAIHDESIRVQAEVMNDEKRKFLLK